MKKKWQKIQKLPISPKRNDEIENTDTTTTSTTTTSTTTSNSNINIINITVVIGDVKPLNCYENGNIRNFDKGNKGNL